MSNFYTLPNNGIVTDIIYNPVTSVYTHYHIPDQHLELFQQFKYLRFDGFDTSLITSVNSITDYQANHFKAFMDGYEPYKSSYIVNTNLPLYILEHLFDNTVPPDVDLRHLMKFIHLIQYKAGKEEVRQYIRNYTFLNDYTYQCYQALSTYSIDALYNPNISAPSNWNFTMLGNNEQLRIVELLYTMRKELTTVVFKYPLLHITSLAPFFYALLEASNSAEEVLESELPSYKDNLQLYINTISRF